MMEPSGEHPMRLLFTTDVVGGVWDFCCALARTLTRDGHEVTLLAFGDPSSDQERQARMASARLISAPLKLEWMRDSAGDVEKARVLAERIARETRADVLHANQFALGTLSSQLPVVLTAHSDILSWLKWNSPTQAPSISAEVAAYVSLVGEGLANADAIVAVTQFVACEITALYAIDRPWHVIHNGWPQPIARPLSVKERSRTTLLAGRVWDSAKNISLAVEAARDWNSGTIVLAGSQHHPETGTAVNLGETVTPLGMISREEIDRWLGQARAYVAPARYEPFGLLALQAALAGCPLLLSDIPSFRELWDGVALFFQSNDATDLRRQWQRLLDDEALASRLADMARHRAEKRYLVETMASSYVALYRQVASARRGISPRARQEMHA